VAFASLILCHQAKSTCLRGQLDSNVRAHMKFVQVDRLLILRAAVVSALLAVALTVFGTLFFGYGMEYNPPYDPDWLARLPPDQQATWLREHSHELRGITLLFSKFRSTASAIEFLKDLSWTFVYFFIASFATGYWQSQAIRRSFSLNRTGADNGRIG